MIDEVLPSNTTPHPVQMSAEEEAVLPKKEKKN
jgi:hypothetical protein